MTEDAMRESQDRLLRQAADLLLVRHANGNYAGVSSAEAAGIVGALEAAVNADEVDGDDRQEAVALAHRLLDDDTPEASPLWPGSPE